MSSSTAISQRFQRVSSLQKEREAEYGKQASEAHRLLERLRETRIEAEQAAKEEIERTRRIQVEEIQTHPDMLKLKQSIRNLEKESREWGQKVERKSQELREQIAGLERQLVRKQDELNRVQVQLGESAGRESQLRGQIENVDRRLKDLRSELGQASLNEDDINTHLKPAYEEHNRMVQNLDSLKAQKAEATRQWENFETKSQALTNMRNSLQREIEGLREELGKWDQRAFEAREQSRRASDLFNEAQELCNLHKQKIDQIATEAEQRKMQLSALQEERHKATQFLLEISSNIDGRKRTIEALEGGLGPLRNRYDAIQEQIRKLQEEANFVQSEYTQKQHQASIERSQLEGLLPTQQQAEHQVTRSTEIYRVCEQDFASCESRSAEERVKAEEFRAKASEASREVQRAKELTKEVEDGMQIASLTLSQRQEKLDGVQRDLQSLENKLSPLMNPKYLESRIQEQQKECDSLEMIYRKMLEDQRVARRHREDLEHQVKANESKIRSLEAQIEESRSHGPSSVVERLREEVRRLDDDITNYKHELGSLGGTNPHQAQYESAKQRSSQLEVSIYSSWSPENAPPRLLDQLKREAEVVMRAEAALTLERQQESVTADASRMTRYHIMSKPRFDIDQQATKTLISEHTQGKGAREIASTVLEMCEQHHIHA